MSDVMGTLDFLSADFDAKKALANVELVCVESCFSGVTHIELGSECSLFISQKPPVNDAPMQDYTDKCRLIHQ